MLKLAFCACALAVFACDSGEESGDLALQSALDNQDIEQAALEVPQDEDYSGSEILPFAEFERDGHQVSFHALPDGEIVVQESSPIRASNPLYVASGRSPLEIYWLLSSSEDELPEVLVADYENRIGDSSKFIAENAMARGAGADADDLNLTLTMKPQESKWWWGGGCIPTSSYTYADCFDSWTGSSAKCHNNNDICNTGHPFRFSGSVLYSILRDTDDTNREVRLRWDDDSFNSGSCDYAEGNILLNSGAWVIVEPSGTQARSWYGRIAGGCSNCYEFRSIFMWNTTQTSTCTDPF